jgi:hypothetical protein
LAVPQNLNVADRLELNHVGRVAGHQICGAWWPYAWGYRRPERVWRLQRASERSTQRKPERIQPKGDVRRAYSSEPSSVRSSNTLGPSPAFSWRSKDQLRRRPQKLVVMHQSHSRQTRAPTQRYADSCNCALQIRSVGRSNKLSSFTGRKVRRRVLDLSRCD